MRQKAVDAEWDHEQEMKVVRAMRMRYAEFLFSPCVICGHWAVVNLDVPIKAHPLCFYDPAYQRALKAAPDPNQGSFTVGDHSP